MSQVISARVRTSALQLSESVRSVVVLELLKPGSIIYLSSPVLQNSLVLSNRMGQYSALFPELEIDILRLDSVLALLDARGVSVRVIHSPGTDITSALPEVAGTGILSKEASPLLYKGLATDKALIRGTIHFAAGGIALGDEQIELVTDQGQVQRVKLEMDDYWQELQ